MPVTSVSSKIFVRILGNVRTAWSIPSERIKLISTAQRVHIGILSINSMTETKITASGVFDWSRPYTKLFQHLKYLNSFILHSFYSYNTHILSVHNLTMPMEALEASPSSLLSFQSVFFSDTPNQSKTMTLPSDAFIWFINHSQTSPLVVYTTIWPADFIATP